MEIKELESLTKEILKATDKRVACSVLLKTDRAERIVHPYGVCKTEKDKVALVCWQVSGYSEKGKLPQFRNLNLENIKTLKLLTNRFIVNASFNPDDRQYVEWVFHI